MIRKRFEYGLRHNGYFHLPDGKYKAVHKGDGIGVAWVMQVSPVDVNLGRISQELYEKVKDVEFYFFPSIEEIEEWEKMRKGSDDKTYELRGGKGWANGPRPYQKLQDFM